MQSRQGAFLLACAAFCLALPARAEPLARALPAAGAVIARKSGEEVRFVDVTRWQYVDLQQSLLTGDVLRTNATGQLAVLFSDRTQVRLGRNTSLLVKGMGQGADTALELQSGTIWARAERGGQGLAIDTPAATAAIRGTDWTLTVDAGGRTSLIVLEGLVDLSNAQGSVRVARGEAAVASIGQAPQKIVIVDPKDREQMLFYLSLRSSFVWMPASPLPIGRMGAERRDIEAILPERRTAEEWLTLAEADLTLTGRQPALAALAQAKRRGLSRRQRARAELIEALVAGSQQRYADAARLFRSAAPGLDPQRRSIAVHGGYYARALADPAHVEKPPADASGAYGALAQAWTAGFLHDIKAAIDIVAGAERRYPGDSTLPAARAQFALLIDDRAKVKEAIARALSINPRDPMALEARGNYRAGYESDIDGAIADFQAAVEIAPGSTTAWNGLGLALSSRGDDRRAEAALKRSITLDPDDPVSHANLAILYLDQMRMTEARAEIDIALAVDPAFDMALVARGRYHMQTGAMDKAMADLLAGSTANPGVAQAQLMLAAVHSETGNHDAAAQAIDNAERLDAEDPVVAAVRTAIAIDDFDSDGAIRNAQQFLQRGRARGGHFGALSANQDAGSTLNNAFRLQGLDAWGQYYGDIVFDPFAGSSHIDQTLRGSADPFVNDFTYGGNAATFSQNSLTFSSFIQGLMLEPHMLSGRSRTANLLRRPFVEGAIGGGFTHANGKTGRTATAQVQGYSNSPMPFSLFATGVWQNLPTADALVNVGGSYANDSRLLSGTAYMTTSPTPDDHVVGFFSRSRQEDHLTADVAIPEIPPLPAFVLDTERLVNGRSTNAGLTWSHTFDYRNIANAGIFFTDVARDSSELGGVGGIPRIAFYNVDRQRNIIAAINHMVGDDDLVWRYGLEGGRLDTFSEETRIEFSPFDAVFGRAEDAITIGRAYVDALYDVTPDLKLEGALFGSYLSGDSVDVRRLEPRAGLAWSPAQGHWLRLVAMREGFDLNIPTLSPIGMVGLQSNQRSLRPEGYADTIAARWEAEWTDSIFTAVDFQHQQLDRLSIAVPLTADNIDLTEGRIDRASVTANLAIGHGFGLSATAAYADSENEDPSSTGYGFGLPFVPETAGQIAVTWVNEANIKATLAANYTGKRQGDALQSELDGYWTLDARMEWEPLDKRFAIDLAAYNLLDAEFDVAPSLPGWGRTFVGSLKVRF